MQGLVLSCNEFVAAIQMSKLPHILLEGSNDKAFFMRMCEAAFGTAPQSLVTITTAEQIKAEDSVVGNRDKVEKVCELVARRSFRNRFLGFVDREFRGFAFVQALRGCLKSRGTC